MIDELRNAHLSKEQSLGVNNWGQGLGKSYRLTSNRALFSYPSKLSMPVPSLSDYVWIQTKGLSTGEAIDKYNSNRLRRLYNVDGLTRKVK